MKKCQHCGAEIYDDLIYCPSCGYELEDRNIEDVQAAPLMNKNDFLYSCMPFKYTSYLHSGIILMYLSTLVAMLSAFYNPVIAIIETLIFGFLAIGLHKTKTLGFAVAETIVASVCVVINLLLYDTFSGWLAIISGVFACIGASKLNVAYTVYLASGKKPDLTPEEADHISVRATKTRKNLHIAATIALIATGVAFVAAAIVHISAFDSVSEFTRGSFDENGVYTNEFVDVTIEVPDAWTVYTEDQLADIEEEAKASGAYSYGGGMLWYAENAAGSYIMVEAIVQSSPLYGGYDYLTDISDDNYYYATEYEFEYEENDYSETVTLNSKEYNILTCNYEYEGTTFCERYLCRQEGYYMILITICANDESVLDAAMSWMEN